MHKQSAFINAPEYWAGKWDATRLTRVASRIENAIKSYNNRSLRRLNFVDGEDGNIGMLKKLLIQAQKDRMRRDYLLDARKTLLDAAIMRLNR